MTNRKKVDPRVIGIFVIGAIILVVAALLFFGPGGLFAETRRYVIFFESSVKGLSVGSPVRFRGVKIGQVKEINIKLQPDDLEFHIPVVIEVEPDKIATDGIGKGLFDTLMTTVQGEDPVLPLVAKGLRAQLQLDSLVTGQLYINLDMFPAAAAVSTQHEGDYPRIPAVTSSLEELTRTFEELPLQLLAEKLMQSADGVQRIFTSPSLHNAIEQFGETTSLLNQLLGNLNDNLPLLMARTDDVLNQSRRTLTNIDQGFEAALIDVRTTLEQAQDTIRQAGTRLEPLAATVERSLSSVDQAAADMSATMLRIQELSDAESPFLQQFSLTLQELNRTLRSMRALADEIERNPQILLRGRSPEE